MVSFSFIKHLAFLFFGIGTVLFILGLIVPDPIGIFILGFLFVVIATFISTIFGIILLIDLIKNDRLESFFGLCLLLANVPIAMGYFYILIES